MVVKRSTKTSLHSDKATSSWRHSSHNSEQNCEGEFLHLIGSFFVITLPLKVLSEWSASPSVLFCVLLWNGQTTGTHIQCTVCWVGRVAVKGVTPVVGPTCPRNLWSFMCPTGNGHFWYFRQTLGIFGTAKIAPLLNRFFEKSVHFKNNLCFLFFNDVGRLPIVASFFAF